MDGTTKQATATDRTPIHQAIDAAAQAIEAKIIAWRRDFHEHPELGNRETRTAGIVAEHLRKLGMEVKTKVAHTGVVGLLKGGRTGPVVALRADMDALPVSEEVDLPFASKVRSTFAGQEVGVMHACGHDAHVAILMGVAEVLAGMRETLPGTVKFIFQPAEEMPPPGEDGGAAMMIREGVLKDPKPDAIFGLHVTSIFRSGQISYRPGPAMASADTFSIKVNGRQTHAARPWQGVDPIVVASQIVLGLQTIESRQVAVTKEPSILSIGTIHGGVRGNIIPDSVEMNGTVRAFDEGMRDDIHMRLKRTADLIAKSAGALADVVVTKCYPVTVNDPDLTAKIVPTLERVAGPGNAFFGPKNTGSEDFSFFEQIIPGVFFFVGITPKDVDLAIAAPNHSPRFFVDESGLLLGARALAQVTVDYLHGL